jgi:hypothetical protein
MDIRQIVVLYLVETHEGKAMRLDLVRVLMHREKEDKPVKGLIWKRCGLDTKALMQVMSHVVLDDGSLVFTD